MQFLLYNYNIRIYIFYERMGIIMKVKEVEFIVRMSVYPDESEISIKHAIERGLDKEGYACISVDVGDQVGEHEEEDIE